MKTIIKISTLLTLLILINSQTSEAKGSFYKSSSSGKFTTKSYANSNKSTTYKSSFK